MVSTGTCTDPVSWYISGDRKTVSAAVTIWFLRLHLRRCILETVLGSVGTFQLRALVIGRLPCSVGNRQGCAAPQTKSCPCLVLPGCHCQRGVFVTASSEVLRHRHRIPTDQLMKIDYYFSCHFSLNLRKDRCQKVRKDPLEAACCPRHIVLHILLVSTEFIPWDNLSNLLKARCILTRRHWIVEFNGWLDELMYTLGCYG